MDFTEKPVPFSTVKANAEGVSKLLKAIANENRLLILYCLEPGELSVSELNSHFKLSQSALSQHLAVLRKNNLVNTRRDSQTIYYSLADSKAIEAIRALRYMYPST